MSGSMHRRDPMGDALEKALARTTWDEIEIDERRVARYRFERTRYARLRARLDGIAFVYVVAAGIATAKDLRRCPPTPLEALSAVRSGCTFEPPLPRWTVLGVPVGLLLLLLLLGGILFHQSRWLKLHIEVEMVQSGYAGFLSGWEEPLNVGQVGWTAISRIADYVFVVGVLASMFRYLLDLPSTPLARNPEVVASLIFGGMVLVVMGAFDLMEVILARRAQLPLAARLAQVAVCVGLGGAAFALVFGLGLRSDQTQVQLGAGFGAALALGTALGTLGLRHPERPLPARVQSALRRTVLPPLVLLAKGLDDPLTAALTLGLLPVEGVVLALRLLILAAWYALTPIIAPLSRLLFGEPWWFASWKLRKALRDYQHDLRRRVRIALLHGLLKGDGWLPRLIKRDPVRYRSFRVGDPRARGGYFTYTDPLRPEAGPTYGFGNANMESVERLYRRLLDLMLATFVVVFLVELLVGHTMTFVGRPLLHMGIGYAVGYGLVVGLGYVLLSTLGRSSVGGLAVGLVSGLSLAPAVGLVGGLALRLGHSAVPLLLSFVLALMTSTLGRRGLVVVGALALLAGAFLMQV